MSPEIFICEQNSPEWHRARMGIATASAFDAILTPGKTKTEQKTRRTYMLKLAGEILTGMPMDMVMTRDMERGHLLEPEARDLYVFQTGAARVERVGFIKYGRAGCSPDSLIGDDGGLEIKTKFPHLLLDLIEKDEFPEEHKAQVQGALWLTGRQWWDLEIVACVEIDGRPALAPNIPPFIKRAHRDEVFIANLAAEVDRFNADLDGVVQRMRERQLAALPNWIALRDLTPSPALLASRIVQEGAKAPAIDTTTLAPNGMPAFLVRKPAPQEPLWREALAQGFEDCVDLVSGNPDFTGGKLANAAE